jgi:hypothetical protein
MSANKKGKAMTSEQIPMSAREILTKGWELKQQSMALGGMPVPDLSNSRSTALIISARRASLARATSPRAPNNDREPCASCHLKPREGACPYRFSCRPAARPLSQMRVLKTTLSGTKIAANKIGYLSVP